MTALPTYSLARITEENIRPLQDTLRRARAWMDAQPARPAAIESRVLRADGRVALVRIGPRGGWRHIRYVGTTPGATR